MKRIPIFHKYIIDKEFQYSYIISSLMLLLFVMVSMFAVIIIWNKFRFYQGFLLSPPSGEQLMLWAQENGVKADSMELAYQYIAQAKPYTFYQIIFSPLMIIFIVNAFVISLASLFISYKIAGPLCGLKRALRKKIETGEIDKPLDIREGDLFHELSSLANLAFFIARNPKVKETGSHDKSEIEKPIKN